MRLHAIQTGSVRIKTAQVEGHGRGLRRRLGIFTDRNWTPWLPSYAWVVEHPEGVIVVDTGQGTHLLESATSLHPYARWEVAFRIEREQEIGPQLRARGIGPGMSGVSFSPICTVITTAGWPIFPRPRFSSLEVNSRRHADGWAASAATCRIDGRHGSTRSRSISPPDPTDLSPRAGD